MTEVVLNNATESLDRLRERSAKVYRAEIRFSNAIQMIVARALLSHGRIDRERIDREAYDIAMETAAMVLQLIYEEDQEIRTLKAEAEHFKKLAEDALLVRGPPFLILKEKS